MSKLVSSLMVVLAVVVLSGTLTACNTVEGVGKDVKSAGKKIEEVAK